MNKTIIINISGVIFHIEEDAYEMLKNYMNGIKKHFSTFQDHLEIITDIENRIAEMFTELLTFEKKEVILKEDVAMVISKMGSPSDFGEESEFTFTEDEANQENQPQRKLFRDIDDRIIGGVCAGIGHYFDVEARWMRVGFFVLFIFYGFGLLPYLLLWIVMPKAGSRTEKMEMKGEKINLQSFQKNVEQEINAVSESILKAHQYAKPGLGRLSAFIRALIFNLAKFTGNTGLLILKIIGVIIITAVGITLIVAFIALIVFLGYAGNADVTTLFPINALTAALRPVIYICTFLVILIPLIGIILLALRIIFNRRKIAKTVGFGLLMIWIIALSIGIFSIAKNATDFKEKASFREAIELTNNQQVYYLQIGEERTVEENIINGQSTKTITIKGSDKDFDTPNSVSFDLHLTENGKPSIIKTYSARGKNFDAALNNAKQIEYYYTQKDSLLVFDSKSGLKEGGLWRNQEVRIKLNIPVGTVLYIQKSFARHFLQSQLYSCIDDEKDEEDLIKVTATKQGFTCKITEKEIKKQQQDNQEQGIKGSVSDLLTF